MQYLFFLYPGDSSTPGPLSPCRAPFSSCAYVACYNGERGDACIFVRSRQSPRLFLSDILVFSGDHNLSYDGLLLIATIRVEGIRAVLR